MISPDRTAVDEDAQRRPPALGGRQTRHKDLRDGQGRPCWRKTLSIIVRASSGIFFAKLRKPSVDQCAINVSMRNIECAYSAPDRRLMSSAAKDRPAAGPCSTRALLHARDDGEALMQGFRLYWFKSARACGLRGRAIITSRRNQRRGLGALLNFHRIYIHGMFQRRGFVDAR